MRAGQEDQLFSAQRNGHAGGQVFHGQVEGVARRRETQRRQQHHRRTFLDGELQRLYVDLAHLAGVLVVHAVQHAGGARRHEIAGNDADVRVRHRRVGQALAERRFDIQADFARGFLGAFQRGGVGGRQAAVELLGIALQAQLLIDLRTRAMHQHQPDAQGRQQRQVLHQGVQRAGLNQLAAERHYEGLASERMHIGRYVAKPSDELRGCEFRGFKGGDGVWFQVGHDGRRDS
ncbi:hypothetical protein D3C71_1499770 [compost metagenome]